MTTYRLILIVVIGVSLSFRGAAVAQVITDGSLGAARSLTGPNYSIPSDLGFTKGANLFHSFSQFNLTKGESALFSGPPTIQNIISRVTGGEASNIDGSIISSILGANLYFINPKGIMFGPNASLNISGSFYATTADYLKLGASGRFDATTPANSILTIDDPSAFGFLGSNPGGIKVDRSRLSVPKEKTLSIVGGNIDITNDADTTVLGAPGGRINLASVASSGELILTPTGIDATAFSNMGSISVAHIGDHYGYGDIDASTIDAAIGSGSIYISGGKFVTDNGFIYSYTPGKAQIGGKSISIDARDGAEIKNGSLICTDTYSSGSAGNINITASNLNVSDNSNISAETLYGSGSSGKIFIEVKNDVNLAGFSSISTSSFEQGTGNAGSITVNANHININDFGLLSASSYSINGNGGIVSAKAGEINLTGSGKITATSGSAQKAGKIYMIADKLTMDHGDIDIITDTGIGGIISINAGEIIMDNLSIIGADLSLNSRGTAGDILITTKRLEMIGSSISTETYGSGRGGDITINGGGDVIVEKQSAISSETWGSGSAGKISMDIGSLEVNGGAVSSSALYSSGNASDILINASGTVKLSAFGSIASKSSSSGNSGFISIYSKLLNVETGGKISTDADFFSTGRAGHIEIRAEDAVTVSGAGSQITSTTDGPGRAGDITLDAGSVTLSKGGDISAKTYNAGAGGAISIRTVGDINISGGGFVSTEAVKGSSGKGGSIFVTAAGSLSLTNGTISAKSSSTGDAGNLTIKVSNGISMDGGAITTAASNAAGGNITIDPAMMYLRNSSITTSVNGGKGDGGNIALTAGTLLLKSSNIIAKAVGGKGGNISINSDVFIFDPTSIVSASSQLGLAGVVGITAPLVDLSGNMASLPEGLLNENDLAPRQCVGTDDTSSSFVIGEPKRHSKPDRYLPSY